MEEGLVRKLAWSFHRTTGIEYDDLVQEAAFCWYKWVVDNPQYDPRRCAFTTWATMCIKSHLLNIAIRHRRSASSEMTILNDDIRDNGPQPHQNLEFLEELRALSDEGRLVVRMIFDAPYELLHLTPHQAQRELLEKLKEEYGLTHQQARAAIAEVRELLV